jgi:hypothetical protein
MRLKSMNPTAPTKYVWIIGLVLGILVLQDFNIHSYTAGDTGFFSFCS